MLLYKLVRLIVPTKSSFLLPFKSSVHKCAPNDNYIPRWESIQYSKGFCSYTTSAIQGPCVFHWRGYQPSLKVYNTISLTNKFIKNIQYPHSIPYRYHELRPLISYFPCRWVVLVDITNTCPRVDSRDFYTLTRKFSNQQ